MGTGKLRLVEPGVYAGDVLIFPRCPDSTYTSNIPYIHSNILKSRGLRLNIRLNQIQYNNADPFFLIQTLFVTQFHADHTRITQFHADQPGPQHPDPN